MKLRKRFWTALALLVAAACSGASSSVSTNVANADAALAGPQLSFQYLDGSFAGTGDDPVSGFGTFYDNTRGQSCTLNQTSAADLYCTPDATTRILGNPSFMDENCNQPVLIVGEGGGPFFGNQLYDFVSVGRIQRDVAPVDGFDGIAVIYQRAAEIDRPAVFFSLYEEPDPVSYRVIEHTCQGMGVTPPSGARFFALNLPLRAHSRMPLSIG